MASLPTEIQWHIFSFLKYHELYALRSISRQWKSMVEEHIYFDIKKQQHTIDITVGQYPFLSNITLVASSYDEENQIIEFQPNNGGIVQQLQIKFSLWKQLQVPSAWLKVLTPQEKPQASFHMQFNPNLECTYNYPAFDYFKDHQHNDDQHYVGDKSLILSFSYIPQNINDQSTEQQQEQNHPNDPYFFYNNTSITSRNLSLPLPPKIKIHWLRVTMDWIISGFKPSIQPTQIYNNRYTQLYQTLVQHYGCVKYDEYSEPVIDYIVHNDHHDKHNNNNNNNNSHPFIPSHLISYIQEHSHECQTRLKRLQHMLEGAGLDHRMIWKYNFAKTYIIENSLLSEEDIVNRILDTEEEWRILYQSLLKRLKLTH
ncbi:unnamed protein product [Cunninghamella blakesleeana]